MYMKIIKILFSFLLLSSLLFGQKDDTTAFDITVDTTAFDTIVDTTAYDTTTAAVTTARARPPPTAMSAAVLTFSRS